MAVTIDQIAKKVGVSSSTVARVLRGDVKGAQQRSAQKSREILRVSEELGYRPNWRARALSSGKTHTIGLLYSDAKWIFEDPMNEIAISFTESLRQQGYDLRLIPASNPECWKELVLGGAVDGLALMLHAPEGVNEVIKKNNIPTIFVGNKTELESPHILPDDYSGSYTATRHLIGLGHSRIVFYVSDTIRPHLSITERRNGYEQAMHDAGLSDLITNWHCSTDEAMKKLVGREAPTAMVGYCHIEALRIVHAAWAHGISIPTDLSLIAFNDIAVTEHMTPPLTVVGYDTAEMGRLASDMLISQIEMQNQDLPESVLVNEKLIVRGTTAPPKSR